VCVGVGVGVTPGGWSRRLLWLLIPRLLVVSVLKALPLSSVQYVIVGLVIRLYQFCSQEYGRIVIHLSQTLSCFSGTLKVSSCISNEVGEALRQGQGL